MQQANQVHDAPTELIHELLDQRMTRGVRGSLWCRLIATAILEESRRLAAPSPRPPAEDLFAPADSVRKRRAA